MESLTRAALRFPGTTLALVVLVTLVAALGLPRSTTNVGYRGFLGDDHPAVRTLDDHIDNFNGGLPVIAVWGCEDTAPCESIFDDSAIWMAKAVEAEMLDHPLVIRVESPVSSGVVLQTENGIEARNFVEDGKIPADRDELARRYLEDDMPHGYLASSDGRVGAIVVQLDSTDSDTAAQIVPALQAALAPHEAQGFVFHLVGDPVDFVIAGGEMKAETPRILPLMVLLIAAVVYLLTRSLWTTLVALAVSGLAVLWTMGFMAWLGWPEIEITQALPPTVLVIGMCDAIHFLSRYSRRLSQGDTADRRQREAWILEVAREVGPPCLVTSLTTAAAFLSFMTSNFDSFLRFGVTAASGVMMALLLSFTLLPLLLIRIPPRRLYREPYQRAWDDALGLISETVSRQHTGIIWIAAAMLPLSIFGMLQLDIDIDERELLGQNSKVVRWAQYVEDNLRKPDSLEIALSLPEGETAAEPAVAAKLAEITQHLPSIPGLGDTVSYLDFLGPMNQILHEDDPAWNRPADTRAANAQLLFALEMDFQPLVNDWVTTDHQQLRVFVEAENLSTGHRREALNAVADYLEETLPPGWDISLTGPLVVYMELVDEIQDTQLKSFLAAGFIIGLMFYIYLRVSGSGIPSSTKWTFIGLAPTVFPVLVTLGTMGLLGVPLDAGTAMVAAIVLGVAVDDSFHLITAYRRERVRGATAPRAIDSAVRNVGRALVTTSFALSIGFFSLALSSWQSLASFGFLAGVAIITALFADLIILPALVLTLANSREAPVEPLAPSRIATVRQRGLLTTALITVVLGSLSVAFWSILQHESGPRLSCWVYPNQVVALTSVIDNACPLQSQDKLTYLEVAGERFRPQDEGAVTAALAASKETVSARIERGREYRWVDLPVVTDSVHDRMSRFTVASLLSFAMIGIAIFLVWCSSSPATIPYAALYASFSVVIIYLLCSPGNEMPGAPYVVASSFLPPILIHLAFNFPHQRAVLRRVPALLYFIYGMGAGVSVIALYGFYQHSGLWTYVSVFLTTSVAMCGAMLVVSSSIARRDAVTTLERTRATSAFWGTLIIPALLGATLYSGRFDNLLVAACGALLIPLPVGYAMTRYQLYDARPHARQLAFSVVFSLVYTGILTLGWFLVADSAFAASVEFDTATQLGLIFILLLSAELVRSQLWNLFLQRIPTIEAHLRDFEDGATRDLRRLNSEEDTAKLLADSIQHSLNTTGVSVFLNREQGWRLAAARGDSPSEISAVEPVLEQLDLGEDPIHMALEGGAQGEAADRLRALDLAIVAPLHCRGELLALLLIKEARDRMPYTMTELDFVQRLCAQSAVAIHNARLNAELLRVERYSTIGRIATGLMHDIGKPMSIVWQRAKKMAKDPQHSPEVREMAGVIETMTDEALSSIDRLMEHAREGLTSPVAEVATGEVIERAVDAVSRIHENRNVCVRLTPNLPRISGSDELHLALVNLLDNALLASDPDETTDVFCTADDSYVTIQIIDRGCGMSPEVRARAFDPFFTTRSAYGGSGIGLAASRTTIERLGGTVSLDSEEGVGTTVTIRLAL